MCSIHETVKRLVTELQSIVMPQCFVAADCLAYIARRDNILEHILLATSTLGTLDTDEDRNATFSEKMEFISVNQQALAHDLISRTFDQHKEVLRQQLRAARDNAEKWKKIALSKSENVGTNSCLENDRDDEHSEVVQNNLAQARSCVSTPQYVEAQRVAALKMINEYTMSFFHIYSNAMSDVFDLCASTLAHIFSCVDCHHIEGITYSSSLEEIDAAKISSAITQKENSYFSAEIGPTSSPTAQIDSTVPNTKTKLKHITVPPATKKLSRTKAHGSSKRNSSVKPSSLPTEPSSPNTSSLVTEVHPITTASALTLSSSQMDGTPITGGSTLYVVQSLHLQKRRDKNNSCIEAEMKSEDTLPPMHARAQRLPAAHVIVKKHY